MDAIAYGSAFVALTAVLNVMKYTHLFGVDRVSMRTRVACMALVYRKVVILYLGTIYCLDDQSNSCTGSEVEPRKH